MNDDFDRTYEKRNCIEWTSGQERAAWKGAAGRWNEIKRGKATRLKGNAGHGPNRTARTSARGDIYIPGKSLLTDQRDSSDPRRVVLPFSFFPSSLPRSNVHAVRRHYPFKAAHVYTATISLCSSFLREFHCRLWYPAFCSSSLHPVHQPHTDSSSIDFLSSMLRLSFHHRCNEHFYQYRAENVVLRGIRLIGIIFTMLWLSENWR